MKSSVITFPGSNCDRDMDVALKKFGFKNKIIFVMETYSLRILMSDLIRFNFDDIYTNTYRDILILFVINLQNINVWSILNSGPGSQFQNRRSQNCQHVRKGCLRVPSLFCLFVPTICASVFNIWNQQIGFSLELGL